jgi:hypothetical protein
MQVSQMDTEARALTIALDRATGERDLLSEELVAAAREKVSALAKAAELSAFIHTCLKQVEARVR